MIELFETMMKDTNKWNIFLCIPSVVCLTQNLRIKRVLKFLVYRRERERGMEKKERREGGKERKRQKKEKLNKTCLLSFPMADESCLLILTCVLLQNSISWSLPYSCDVSDKPLSSQNSWERKPAQHTLKQPSLLQHDARDTLLLSIAQLQCSASWAVFSQLGLSLTPIEEGQASWFTSIGHLSSYLRKLGVDNWVDKFVTW